MRGGGCHIGQCRARRKGRQELRATAWNHFQNEVTPSSCRRLAHQTLRTSLPSVMPGTLTCVFSPAGLFWSSTTLCRGSRAIRPPRTVPPAFPSTLWCSLSCTMPSWIYSDWKSTCSLWLSSFSLQPQFPRNLRHSANTPLPPLETTLHSPALWFLLSRHMSFLQCSVPEWLTDTSLMDLETSTSSDLQPVLTVCAAPNHWATGSFSVGF